MTFTSYGFIIFAAAVLLIYYILPKKTRWMLLLAASLVFYCFAGWRSLVFMLTTVTTVYAAAFLVEKTVNRKFVIPEGRDPEDKEAVKKEKNRFKDSVKRKTDLISAICVIINLGMMFIVRFTSMFAVLGISFYTLQAFGYLFDVKRKKYPHEKNWLKLALFLMFFPQLVQGPINRYDLLSKTLYSGADGRDHYRDLSFGLLRMSWGFFEKLVIADRISVALGSILEADGRGIYVLAAMVFYAVRLYGDFKGGIDIALGFSEALGIENSENFERPYFSKSIAEYWRRWHITLGTWMKDYVFYPISVSKIMLKTSKKARERLGNGLGKRITVYMSTIAVWLLTGLWHGTAWNFILWGMLNCVIILISQECGPLYKKFANRFPKIKGSKAYGCFEVVRTFFLMSTLRMLDCYTNVGDYFGKIFSIFSDFIPKGFKFASFGNLGLTAADYIIVGAGCLIIFAVSLASELHERKGLHLKDRFKDASVLIPIAAAVLFAAVIILGAYGRGYDVQDFIYTRF